MTVHHNFNATPVPSHTTPTLGTVKTPQINAKRVRHLALSGGATAAREHAAAEADRLNAGLRARLEAFLADATTASEKLLSTITNYEGQADGRSAVLWRRLRSSDPDVRMSRMEVVQCVFYIALTVLALGVATYALALMLTELGVIEKLSESIWQAMVYAFPVVLASSGFASMATLHDDEKVIEKRTMRVFIIGSFFFVAWMAMTAIVFVGEQGGYNPTDILSPSNDPFAAATTVGGTVVIEETYAIVRALFPSGLTSSLLLFVHIIAEVLIAAGLTARVVLMGRKTREITAYHCPRALLARKKVAELELQKRAQDILIAGYKDQIAEIDAVKAQHIEDVALLATSEERVAQALREAAQARAVQDYLEAAN
jgi:hypothetical protein